MAYEMRISDWSSDVCSSDLSPVWAYSQGSTLGSSTPQQVVIDHGSGIKTVLHGMSTLSVRPGQDVSRGDVIGAPMTSEVFFAVLFNGQPHDPATINRHFRAQNEKYVPGQGGKLRFAPDFRLRDFSEGVVSTLVSGYRYFVAATCA